MGDSILCRLTATKCTGVCRLITETLTCQKVCPTQYDFADPAHVESEEQLWDKFVLMHHADKLCKRVNALPTQQCLMALGAYQADNISACRSDNVYAAIRQI